MEYFIAFIFGITIGSFLNVCIYRIPKGESIISPPSHCPQCCYQLRARDLLPILSYIFLRGKCRQCGRKIPWRYPLIELLTGLIFVLVVYKYGFTLQALFYCLFSAALIVVAFIDFDHFLIPNGLVLGILIIGIGFHIFIIPFNTFNALLASLGAGAFFLILQTLSRGGMGGGDVKLVTVLGLWLGWPDIALAIFLGSLIGSISGVFSIVSKVKKRKDPIPYGPFLVLGTLLTLLAGDIIWQWYLNLIL